MSSITPELIRNCHRCSSDLELGALACPKCHALVHAEELEKLASEAKILEANGDFRHAREQWLMAVRLLPKASKQSEWIRNHAQDLDKAAFAAEAQVPESENKWTKRLAPLGPVAIILAKSKGLFAAIFQLKFLLSLASFIGVYWALYGMRFGIGFAVLILIHEMGHFIDIKRRGLPADMPVFLPGFGAYVRWQAIGVSAEIRAFISLAGPFAGLIGAAICVLLWMGTNDGLWAALAKTSAWLNVLNLIPVWVLDGGQAASALSKTERIILLTGSLILWLVLGQGIFFLVAAGAGYRLFTKDMPSHPSHAVTIYYLVVLASLGLVMWIVPGTGFGPR